MAVEIDLAKPLVLMVRVRNRIQRIEFEGLHVICFECSEVGHRSKDCARKKCMVAEQETDSNRQVATEQA